jgi:hypothetical protein
MGNCLEGTIGQGRGKEKYWGGVKRMEVHCIYTYEDPMMKPTKRCLQKGEKGAGE